MPIRLKILLACLGLTALTLALGGYTRTAQKELGDVAIRIYDDAFLAVSYLRSAQNNLVRSEASFLRGGPDSEEALAAALPDVLEDLEVAKARAMSEAGRRSTAQLAEDVTELARQSLQDRDATLATLNRIEDRFQTAVEIFAGDGFRYRRSVGEIVERSARRTWFAILFSVLVALVITVVLTRSIVPALRRAVAIADAIAEGRLENRIPIRGGGETGQLLRALSTMQNSIAASLARIRALMREQESSHAGKIAAQHAQLDAALNNMTQGLCLFDANRQLVVSNHRFAEMFGPPAPGAAPEAVFPTPELASLLMGRGTAQEVFQCDLPDGRSVAVSRQPVAGGGWVTTYEDVTERRRAEAKLSFMAHHDALTGLPNRVMFREHMEHALGRARRGHGLAVLTLDLDQFKAVNDTLGHSVGDGLLCAVAGRLLGCVRDSDLVVRLGGDEFAVVQEQAVQPQDAAALARRLIEALAPPFLIEEHQVVIGTSIGIVLANGGEDGPDALLKSADLALYRAKAEGRGTFRFFEAEMDALAQARRSLELDLRRALVLNQFELFYQPLVDATHSVITGFEALLRWNHPERGMVSPALFIPLAEEIGVIEQIGGWVLRRACQDAAGWPGTLKVAVNLSPVQFRNRDLAKEVTAVLAATRLPACRLELEITESLLLQDSEGVLAILHEMRALGVRIAMDDFGTGYSSLSYLRRFPFDKIKIDQSFIRGLAENEDCGAIVRAVIGLGRSLGMAVNAEGVETAEQLEALRVEGCSEVQGYFFSKPRPAGEIAGLLQGGFGPGSADSSTGAVLAEAS
ncbi:putative bifunctional diguanylate cyclase/phosphodiesterase [Roseomonas sp. BN140053]|uniref:putative bifunctional diguanylate cyclase/phosphodiesterase n=1 Tax=Roseomonas sp. BN140053 TaxID=3391898 RepID=UPI0039EB3B4C